MGRGRLPAQGAVSDFLTTAAAVGLVAAGAALVEIAIVPGVVLGAAASCGICESRSPETFDFVPFAPA